MSFTGDVYTLRFFNLGSNIGDMIICSLSVELCRVLFDLVAIAVCLAGAVANVADSNRCRCNPKVPSSIPAGGKDFP